MGWKLKITGWRAATALVLILIASSAQSQVQTDGSVGPIVSLSGNMVIPDSLGTQAGANLFHSFSIFNIQTGESARFTSTFPGLTQNIIARVTGSTSSWIDGALASDIPGAALWLINPNGLAFGKNASLDVQGSFHASTAGYLKFEDGKRFNAKMPTGPEVLSVANPSAFGFLSPNPAPISIDGTRLQVRTGKSFALVAGDIDITGGTLQAFGGRIDLVSVAGAGEASINSGHPFDVSSFAALGDISLSNQSKLDVSDYAETGGSIFIRGGRFFMDNSRIENSTGWQNGGPIDIRTMGDVSIGGSSRISTDTSDLGSAGDIRLETSGDLIVYGGSEIYSTASSESAEGDSGDIAVSAANLGIGNTSRIFTSSESFAFGNAGSVSVNASDTIVISGDPEDFGTGIASTSNLSYGNAGAVSIDAKDLLMIGGAVNSESVISAGNSGDVSVNVESLELAGGAILSATNRGFASGGDLTVQASDHISLSSGSVIQSTNSFSGSGGMVQIFTPDLVIDNSLLGTSNFGSGSAGDVRINAGRITLTSGFINSDAMPDASGTGGNIFIEATEAISLTNTGSEYERPRISNTTFGDGNAGSIDITSPKMTLDDGIIDSNSLGMGNRVGSGNAGSITISTGELVLKNGGSVSTDVSEDSIGLGGQIEIGAGNSISITGTSPTLEGFRSGISAATLSIGDAGSIAITTPRLDIDGGSITASTGYSQGNAGDISIHTGSLSVANEGNIQVASYGAGSGGNLRIQASDIIIDGSKQGIYKTGIVSDANGSGQGGDVQISTNTLDIISGARISAKSSGTGNAGNLSLNVGDGLYLTNASIQTSAVLSAGGNIDIQVGNWLRLLNSTISSSADGVTPSDDGGNLTVRKPQFMILNNSTILAQANAGNGGNITLGADYFLQSAGSILSATSKQGLDGQIVIDSPNEVRGTVALLELPSIDIAGLLRERCAAAALRGQSSFTIENIGGIPQQPGDFLISPGICFVPEKKEMSSRIDPGVSAPTSESTPHSRQASNGGIFE